MPPKIRELKARLRKAGFYSRPGKGSHTVWKHQDLPGSDGDDAQYYQIEDVESILVKLRAKLREEY